MLLSAVLGMGNTDINQEQETVHTLKQVKEGMGFTEEGLCPPRGSRRETALLRAVPHAESAVFSKLHTRIRTTESIVEFPSKNNIFGGIYCLRGRANGPFSSTSKLLQSRINPCLWALFTEAPCLLIAHYLLIPKSNL